MNCPICTQPLTDLYPKPRCRHCGYVESCCNPEVPCEMPKSDSEGETRDDV